MHHNSMSVNFIRFGHTFPLPHNATWGNTQIKTIRNGRQLQVNMSVGCHSESLQYSLVTHPAFFHWAMKQPRVPLRFTLGYALLRLQRDNYQHKQYSNPSNSSIMVSSITPRTSDLSPSTFVLSPSNSPLRPLTFDLWPLTFDLSPNLNKNKIKRE